MLRPLILLAIADYAASACTPAQVCAQPGVDIDSPDRLTSPHDVAAAASYFRPSKVTFRVCMNATTQDIYYNAADPTCAALFGTCTPGVNPADYDTAAKCGTPGVQGRLWFEKTCASSADYDHGPSPTQAMCQPIAGMKDLDDGETCCSNYVDPYGTDNACKAEACGSPAGDESNSGDDAIYSGDDAIYFDDAVMAAQYCFENDPDNILNAPDADYTYNYNSLENFGSLSNCASCNGKPALKTQTACEGAGKFWKSQSCGQLLLAYKGLGQCPALGQMSGLAGTPCCSNYVDPFGTDNACKAEACGSPAGDESNSIYFDDAMMAAQNCYENDPDNVDNAPDADYTYNYNSLENPGNLSNCASCNGKPAFKTQTACEGAGKVWKSQSCGQVLLGYKFVGQCPALGQMSGFAGTPCCTNYVRPTSCSAADVCTTSALPHYDGSRFAGHFCVERDGVTYNYAEVEEANNNGVCTSCNGQPPRRTKEECEEENHLHPAGAGRTWWASTCDENKNEYLPFCGSLENQLATIGVSNTLLRTAGL